LPTPQQSLDNRYHSILRQRAEIIDNIVDWLKPRAEDYAEAADGDRVSPGYSAFMTPEKLRVQRIARAIQCMGELSQDAMVDLAISHNIKVEDTVNQVACSKVVEDERLEVLRAETQIRTEQIRERTELATKIVKALKDEKDVDVTVTPEGAIVIKKGQKPTTPIIVR
jgi:hypothetical protein